MALVRRLAEFVTGAQACALPQLDREILRRHATDAALARVLGGSTQEGRLLRQAFAGGVADTVAGMAALVRLTEMDDIHTGSNTTPSSVCVPVAFGLAAEAGCAPDEIESAIYIGIETLVRFGKAMDGANALFKGFWPTRSAATLAACAVACRIFRLPVAETHEALSLALIATAGRSGRFLREPSGRWIMLGAAVATGLRMAAAARTGFRSADPDPDETWIGAAMGLDFAGREMTAGLGEGSVFPELSLKPFATARQCLGAAEAMLFLREAGLEPAAIQKIVVRVPTPHKAMIGSMARREAHGTAFVSAPCQVATAACSPGDLWDVERRHILGNAAIEALAARVEVEGSAELDRAFPRIWSSEIEVVTTGGALRRGVEHALGSPEKRMGDGDLLEKCRKSLAFCGQQARAEEIAALGKIMFDTDEGARRASRLFMEG